MSSARRRRRVNAGRRPLGALEPRRRVPPGEGAAPACPARSRCRLRRLPDGAAAARRRRISASPPSRMTPMPCLGAPTGFLAPRVTGTRHRLRRGRACLRPSRRRIVQTGNPRAGRPSGGERALTMTPPVAGGEFRSRRLRRQPGRALLVPISCRRQALAKPIRRSAAASGSCSSAGPRISDARARRLSPLGVERRAGTRSSAICRPAIGGVPSRHLRVPAPRP